MGAVVFTEKGQMENKEFEEWYSALSDEQKAIAQDMARDIIASGRVIEAAELERRHVIRMMRAKPKCEHVYNSLHSLDGTTKGTLILDEYEDEALNRLDQYRCVKCDRIMRRSQSTGRLYYVRCDMLVDGHKCGKHANFVAFDPTQHRRVWVGQRPYGYCNEHMKKPETPKPKAAPRTILRKKAKK